MFYGRGDFLLVIKDLFEEVKVDDKKRFYKKNKYAKKVEFIRYTDYINNKPFYIIDVNKSYIKAESVQKLLSVFKGNVIVNESLETEIFKEYLFDESDYVIRSLLSALSRIILYEKEIKSIYINLNNIKRSNLNDRSVVFEEIYSIVKYVKNINIDKNNNEEQTTTITNKILAADTLKQTEETYYVYYYDIANEDSEVSSTINRLSEKVYRVDLNDAFNTNFVGEPSGVTSDINSLKVSNPTVVKVVSEQITEFYSGKEEIKNIIE